MYMYIQNFFHKVPDNVISEDYNHSRAYTMVITLNSTFVYTLNCTVVNNYTVFIL